LRRRLKESFQILKKTKPKNSRKRFGNRQLNLEYKNEDLSQTVLSNYNTETNVYIESEFTSMGGSDYNTPGDLHFSTMNSDEYQMQHSHFKNKSNNFTKRRNNGHVKNTFSGEYQNENSKNSNFQKKVGNYFYQENTKKAKQTQKKKVTMSKRTMRQLRETLEKEEIADIKKKHFSNNGRRGRKKMQRIKKGDNTHFSFSNNTMEPDFSSFSNKHQTKNFFKKKNKTGNVFKNEENQNVQSEKKSAIGRIFYLLSKRFQDTRYRNFFMDQVEVLVYKHGIRDPQIMSLLKNLDLRFNIQELCPEESEKEDMNTEFTIAHQQAKMQRKLEKQMTKTNIQKLERVMMLFRGDQLFAPLIRHFNLKKMSFNRHFFVNLRLFAKLAPFRRLHQTVQKRVHINCKAAFSQVLFYVKPNLRLLLMMYAISKVKQRHIVDAFRRIYAFYYERLKKMKELEETKSRLGKYFLNKRKEADNFSRNHQPAKHI
jgi:hypothetical protein